MLINIRKWLAPPVFEGDEDKTRTARVLNTVLATNSIRSGLAGEIWLFR